MPQPDHPSHRSRPHGPKRRSDSTRPTSSRSGTRRGGDRRPYPTASSTTRVSPAKPGSTTAHSRTRGAAAGTSQPTPATVWPAGPEPIDLDASWPTPIVSTIVASFSQPGGRVALLPWPTPQHTSQSAPGERRGLGIVGADGVIERAPGADPDSDNDTENDTEVSDALATVESLDRRGRVVRIATEDNITGPASRPFWADLVGDPDHAPVTTSPASRPGLDSAVLDGPDAVSPDSVNRADLIITSLRPAHGSDHASDLVALVAARLLRVGGILAVLTHCDWPLGELIDPTGAVVASAQNADLLYLQHIVALHMPVRDGRFATELLADADRANTTASTTVISTALTRASTNAVAEEQTRAQHRAAVRGLPAPHRRVHSDVLVFAQPHEHEPLSVSPAEQAFDSGAIR